MPINIDYHPTQGRVNNSDDYQVFKPKSPLNHWVQEFWQLNVPQGHYHYRSMPDNCIDLIINLKRPEETFVITPFSSSIVFDLAGPVSYFGIRFGTLGYQGIIPAPLGEWNNADNLVLCNEILPRSFCSAAYEASSKPMSFTERCACFSKLLLGSVTQQRIDHRLLRFIHYCHQDINSSVDLSDRQCSEFGLSARQLRRLSSQYLGLSPRAFARVLRFQKTLRLMNSGKYPAAWTQHYYDQPHFIRDFKNICGVTPNELQTLSVLYNTD